MENLSSPINDVYEIIGNQIFDGSCIRKSSYCVEVDVADGQLLYNSLTKECVFVKAGENIESLKSQLYEKWYYVPEDFDELQFVDDIRNVLNCTLCQTKGFLGYTILPTTDCNARCFYCFEANAQKVAMSEETANKVVDYICRTRSKNAKLAIEWFGGEPLYNKNVINVICAGLKEKGVEFDSTMISNGYLFDTLTINEAKTLWNLKSVQITLDGTEKVYNRVKAYVYEDVNAYNIIHGNITNLLSSGINVSIRLNIDAYNMQDMRLLVNELSKRYKGEKLLYVYSHTLFEEVGKCNKFRRTQERRKEICNFQKKLEGEITSLGLNNSPSVIKRSFLTSYCKSDTPNTIIVLPDGHLTKCDSFVDGNYVGHIDNDCLDEEMLEKFSKHCNKLEECKSCPLYPECIRLEICCEARCYKEFKDKKIEDMKEYLVKEYNSYLERKQKKAEEEMSHENC